MAYSCFSRGAINLKVIQMFSYLSLDDSGNPSSSRMESVFCRCMINLFLSLWTLLMHSSTPREAHLKYRWYLISFNRSSELSNFFLLPQSLLVCLLSPPTSQDITFDSLLLSAPISQPSLAASNLGFTLSSVLAPLTSGKVCLLTKFSGGYSHSMGL